MTGESVTVTGVTGLPEITAGDDLGAMISGAVPGLRDGDILVVTSKIISKAEGRVIRADRAQEPDLDEPRAGDHRPVAFDREHGQALEDAERPDMT